MKIYDISQEVFGCCVYPGDPVPKKESVLSIKNGDVCNLTSFSMCAHNGTHIGAPNRFIDDGKTVDKASILEAANLAALHSKCKNSSNVAVDYTLVKYVKKPSNAKPGMVIYSNHKTVFVTPSS